MKFRAVALGLSRFLRNEKTLPPLTIAITGEWGTGKSSLMNLLRADLRQYGFQPVWFNAWHHQKEEHLLASLLQNIRLQALPSWWKWEGIIFRLRLLVIHGWRRMLPLVFIISFILVLTGYVIKQLEYLRHLDFSHFTLVDVEWLELVGKIGAPLTLIGTVVTGLRKGLTAFGVKPASLMSSESGKLRVSDLDAQTSFRQKFAVEFRDVTKALNPRTMIIFIDDLDRCRPENVLEVLEAVNFLLSSGDCFVVMGMARERVERCVGLGFKDVAEEMVDDQPSPQSAAAEINKGRGKRSEFAKQYLDKLINIEVPVPAPTPEAFRQLLVPGETLEVRPLKWLFLVVRFAKGLGPALVIGSIFFMAVWVGMSLPQLSTSPSSTPPPANSNAPSAGNTNAPNAIPPGSRNANTDANLNANTPRPTDPSPLPSQPLADSVEPQLPGQWPEYWMAFLVFLLVVGGGLWILTRPLDSIVKDSAGFVQALEVWHPLVAAKRKTPRSVKRFTNRVRYLAMRQRSPKEGSTPLQRFEAAINRRFRLKELPAEEAAPLIPEPSLVALCVVDDFDPDLVRSFVRWNGLIRPSKLVPADLLNNGISEEICQAIDDHWAKFRPTDEQRSLYLEITAGLRVN